MSANLSILQVNINGVKNKITELKNLVENEKPKIVIVNEANTKTPFKHNIANYTKIHDIKRPRLGTFMYVHP